MFRILKKLKKLKKKFKSSIKKFKKNFKKLFSKTPKRKFYYGFYSNVLGINDKVVLIESFHGGTISDSGLVLAQEILESYPDLTVYYATDNMPVHKEFIKSIGLNVKLVDVTTFKYTRILATAKYLLSNASLPIYFVKRPGQVYLQTWHGTPLKTLGKKMRLGIESMYNVQHNFLQADYITQPNQFTKDVIMNDYNLEPLFSNKVVMAGYPRNKIFMQPEKASELRSKLGLDGKTVYAYMPTWRGTSNHDIETNSYSDQVNEIFTQLDEKLNDNQVFYVNFHPILRGSIQLDDYKHIKPFPNTVDGYTFLNCADALITDYSSVFFDFSLTKKPIMLFMYDYEEYLNDRGLCLDVTTLPFRQVFDVDTFCNSLASEDFLSDRYDDTEYYENFFKYDSVDITKKLLKLVIEGDEGDLEIIDYSKNREKRRNVYHPRDIKHSSAFQALAGVVGEDDIVLFEKKWFNKSRSAKLHDEFNDSFNYVITTYTPPRTYLENVLAYLGVKSMADKIHRRDIQRCFPNLNINEKFIRDYTCYEIDCKVNTDIAELINAKPSFSEQSFTLECDIPNGYEVEKVIIYNRDKKIIRISDCTEAEKNGILSVDLKQGLESFEFMRGGRYTPAFVAKKPNGDIVTLLATDKIKNAEIKKYKNKYNRIHNYYKSMHIDCNLPESYYFVNPNNQDIEVVQNTLTNINVAVLPFINPATAAFGFNIYNPNKKNTAYMSSVEMLSIGCRGKKMTVKCRVKNADAKNVEGLILKFRSKIENIEIPFECKARQAGKHVYITATCDFSNEYPLREIYWDLILQYRQDEHIHYISVKSRKPLTALKLYLLNVQCDTHDGKSIIFPYIGKGMYAAFTFREKSEYDTSLVRFKEFVAIALYILLRPILKRKKIWIVFEKFCKTAQDNSLYFFKYCMEELSPKQKKNIYYVIDKRQPDYENIKQYDKHVIQFMSIKHMLYSMAMEVCASSDSTSHLYVWRPKPSIVRHIIKSKKELFLQHGVTALKKVHKLFGKKGSSPMAYFVTCSEIEQNIVKKHFGYTRGKAPITGFARWDVLEDKSSEDDKFILLMPTWRSWLEEVSNEVFEQSDYYKNYTSVITDERLNKELEKNDVKLVLYLHPKFAAYVDSFKSSLGKNVQCVSFGELPLNDLLMRCNMLITDYSSVCWDVLYQDKCVVYYQFDHEQYDIVHGSYIDLATELPGDRYVDKECLIEGLCEYINTGLKPKPEHMEMAEGFFEYRDDKNSERIYEFLKERGH